MTWKEFKRQVEAQGITDEMVVSFIDWKDNHDVIVEKFECKADDSPDLLDTFFVN